MVGASHQSIADSPDTKTIGSLDFLQSQNEFALVSVNAGVDYSLYIFWEFK